MTQIGFSSQHDFYWDPLIVDQYQNDGSILARDAIRQEGKSLLESMVDEAPDDKAREKAKKKALAKEKRASSKARSYARRGKLEELVSEIDTKLAKKPGDFFLHHEKGTLQLALENYKGSIQSLNKAVDLCPMNRIDYLNLAVSHDQTGDQKTATEYVTKYNSIYPEAKLVQVFNSMKPVTPREASATTIETYKKTTKIVPIKQPTKEEKYPF